jgi:hypothetical protein
MKPQELSADFRTDAPGSTCHEDNSVFQSPANVLQIESVGVSSEQIVDGDIAHAELKTACGDFVESGYEMCVNAGLSADVADFPDGPSGQA